MRYFTFITVNAMLFCSFVFITSLQVRGQSSSYSANTIPISGVYSTAFGISALHVNTGSGNTATGYSALYSNTSGGSNTATGRSALYANTTGSGNTAHGYYALFANTSGTGNTATGYFSLFANTGTNNTSNGYQALFSNNTGSSNTAAGHNALYSNTSGNLNSAFGSETLLSNTTGSHNLAVGLGALQNNTVGSFNTSCGNYSLFTNNTGAYNTALGWSANVSADGLSNTTAIGYYGYVDASNKVVIGNTSVTSIGGQVGWTIYSDARVKNDIKENVPGLAFISLLKPVTYHYNLAKENQLLGKKTDTAHWAGKNDIEKINFTGLVAQAVDSAAQKIGYDFSGVDKTGAIMGLRYSDFIVPLIKGMQEQQQQIEELKKLIAAGTTVTSSSMELSDKNAANLNQNAPNPFTTQTVIGFSIPQNAGSAQMLFYDVSGRLISSHNISDRGRGLLTVAAGDLSSGIYSYTLVIDGKIADTKKLIKQ